MLKDKIKKYIIIITVALVSTIAILFFVRGNILQSQIKKIQKRFLEQYNASLHINEAGFTGLTTIGINGISLVPSDGDTLFKADSVTVGIKLLPLIVGHIRLNELLLTRLNLSAVKKDSTDNYSFLLRSKKVNTDSIVKGTNYADLAWKLIKNTFDKIPAKVNLTASNISFKNDTQQVSVAIPFSTIENKQVNGKFLITENNRDASTLYVSGSLNASKRSLDIKLYSDNSQAVKIPYINKKWNAKIAFDTLHIGLEDVDMTAGVLTLSGNTGIKELVMNHPKLSGSNVVVHAADMAYKINIGEDYIAIDSTSVITVNKTNLNPFIKYRQHPSKEITVKFNMPSLPAQDFFESLPQGMFSSFDGIQTKGNLSYRLDFYVDMNQVDSLKFNSDMDKQDGFKITKFGEEFIPKINGSFSYTAYEKGVPVKTFIVGPENPDFTPYDQISDFLKNAILTSEDGSFFGHRGFNEDAFRKSIIENIKKGRFARGGSTISMQLVKNVYLSRNKTIARKAEEALIVWMIENNGLSSKQRMFEVYLNIIEWGPRIYGVREASEFYFKKHPAELNLAECIFMASIIPRPKGFMYSFDMDGNLRPDLAGFYRIISGILLKKGTINQNDFDELEPNVKLKGNAKELLRKPVDADNTENNLWQSFKGLFTK